MKILKNDAIIDAFCVGVCNLNAFQLQPELRADLGSVAKILLMIRAVYLVLFYV